MNPDNVQDMLRVRPFKPLGVRVNDGTSYEIRYPNLALVTLDQLVVGIPDPESNGKWAEDAVYLGWSVIESIEELVAERAMA